MTAKSRQHFTEQAQTERAINLNGQRCGCISHKKIQITRRAANATKQLRVKGVRGQESKADQQPQTED